MATTAKENIVRDS